MESQKSQESISRSRYKTVKRARFREVAERIAIAGAPNKLAPEKRRVLDQEREWRSARLRQQAAAGAGGAKPDAHPALEAGAHCCFEGAPPDLGVSSFPP